MHSVSWIHARAGGWVVAHAMVWARLPRRGALPNSFEKSSDRKLKCARRLRSLASALARARGSEVTQFYWGGRRVHKSEITCIRKVPIILEEGRDVWEISLPEYHPQHLPLCPPFIVYNKCKIARYKVKVWEGGEKNPNPRRFGLGCCRCCA